MCPNLKKIDIECDRYFYFDFNYDFTMIITESDILLKVEYIKDLHFHYDHSHLFELLVEKYRTTLKGLKISKIPSNHFITCLSLMSRFESLESLELGFYFTFKKGSEECFKLLANKCTKLRELRLNTYRINDYNYEFFVDCRQIFFALSDFRFLERLVIDFDCIEEILEGSVECFKHMTRLKHLSIAYSELTLDFFDSIQVFLPNLQYLDIESRQLTFDGIKPFVESLQTMKSLEKVVIRNKCSFGGRDDFQYYYNKNRNSKSEPKVVISIFY